MQQEINQAQRSLEEGEKLHKSYSLSLVPNQEWKEHEPIRAWDSQIIRTRFVRSFVKLESDSPIVSRINVNKELHQSLIFSSRAYGIEWINSWTGERFGFRYVFIDFSSCFFFECPRSLANFYFREMHHCNLTEEELCVICTSVVIGPSVTQKFLLPQFSSTSLDDFGKQLQSTTIKFQ
jgi:hypothetical protein